MSVERLKLIGFNDFHGQLAADKRVADRAVGGAEVFAAYLYAATRGFEERHLIVHAGDFVGASPPLSALLQDEPSIEFLNLFTNEHCSYTQRADAECNVVGTFGNHEFDEGSTEALRLVLGGRHSKGPFLSEPYRGARFAYVSSNVVQAVSGKPLVAPYIVKNVAGLRLGVIGATLTDTPQVVTPSGVAGIRFLDEVQSINDSVALLKRSGVRSIVVTIHQGGVQTRQGEEEALTGEIARIASGLDKEVDVVISGHTHQYTNFAISRDATHPLLVTQAFSAGTALTEIELEVDKASGDVVGTRSWVTTTYADAAPEYPRLAEVKALVDSARGKTEALVGRVIGTAHEALSDHQNAAGESPLGNLIVDAQRAMTGSDIAFTNPGGIRAELGAGPVTWGEAFTVQPFNNDLVCMTLTGEQLLRVLLQQWRPNGEMRMLSVSGLQVSWSDLPQQRLVEVRDAHGPVEPRRQYSVTMNRFLAEGGDGFSVFTEGTERRVMGNDLDALVHYIESHPGLNAPPLDRVQRAP